jgi:hypothetical protein
LLGTPKAIRESLCIYSANVWNPKKRAIQLKVEIMAFLCEISVLSKSVEGPLHAIYIPMWLIDPVSKRLDIQI